MAYDSEIKFRCDSDLRARFERIATLERRDPSDLGRIIFEDYVTAQERAMNLNLRDAPTSSSTPAARPVNYRKRKKG